jgi:hypothetical protein
VLLHIIMVGLLSQVKDKTNMNVVNLVYVVYAVNVVYVVNVVKDNVGVVAVLAMHPVNVDKTIEVMDKIIVNVVNGNVVNENMNVVSVVYMVNVVKNNVGVVAVLAMHSVNVDGNSVNEGNREQWLTSQGVGVVNMNEVYVDGDVIDEKTVEKQVVGGNKDTEEESEKRDMMGNINPESCSSSSSITYFTRQSSTKTEAVHRYVDFPILNHFSQPVTSLSNPGPEQPEKRDVMVDINPESEHDGMETVERQSYKMLEKKNVGDDIISEGKYDNNYPVEEGREHLINGEVFKTNLKGEHDKEKTVGEVEEKQQHKKPEKKDVVADIISEG